MSTSRFRSFTTGVSFTVADTLNKVDNGKPAIGDFTRFGPNLEQLDLDHIDFDHSKFHKVIFDACHHFERDIQKNLLNDTLLKQKTAWRVARITAEDGRLSWGQPMLFPDTTHTVVLSIGPDPAFFFPVGRTKFFVDAPVHSAMVFPNDGTCFLFGSAGTSAILIRGLDEG
jgi:hypothetical protein